MITIKQLNVATLIEQAITHMQEMQYSEYTLKVYRPIWRAIINYAKTYGTEYMSAELGVKAVKKAFNIDIYSKTLNKYQKRLNRAVAMLLEYQETGRVVKHKARYEYSFPPAFETVALGFLNYLGSELVLKPVTVRNNYMALDKFIVYCSFNGAKTVKEIDSGMVTAYLKTFAGYSKSYINAQVRILRRFFEFARNNGETDAVAENNDIQRQRYSELFQAG